MKYVNKMERGGGSCPLVDINYSTHNITTNINKCTEPNIVNIPDTLDFILSESLYAACQNGGITIFSIMIFIIGLGRILFWPDTGYRISDTGYRISGANCLCRISGIQPDIRR